MKKIFCISLLSCLVLGTAFAQQKPTQQPAAPAKPATAQTSNELKNSLGFDVFQLFKGFIASDNDRNFTVFIISAGYERLIAPHYSFGGDVDTYFIDFGPVNGFYFSLAAEGRYYPMSANFEKFFLGTTLGFNLLAVDGKTEPKYGGFFGLTTSLKAGYKLIIKNNLYLEPSMSYVLSKSGGSSFSVPIPLGWSGGLRFGFMF